MIEIINYNNQVPNVLHFLGKSKNHFRSVLNNIVKYGLKLEKPEELTIMTCFNDRNNALLAELLDRHNIEYINSFTGNPEDKWEMPNKIYYFNQALETVTTPYVLLLDANDVVIQNFDNILEKFKETNLDILFNATRNNHPKVLIDKIHDRDWRGEFRYLNAGCVIGKTKAIKNFYIEAEHNLFKYPNPWNSEQFIIRHTFKNYELKLVDFDWKCEIFQCGGESTLLFVKTDDRVIPNKDIYQII